MVLAAVATARLAVLFLSPIELYPDEAQYWAWSRTLDWGYFSKPPMVAWLIAASTGVGGDAEAWVRLPAWACQTLAGGFVFLAGRRLFDARIGFWAAVLYALAPGVGLSSAVASTDAPLLLFLSAATWLYAGLIQTRSLRWAAGLGLALGLATLSKYAAAYFVIGLAAHALLSSDGRRAWSPMRLAAAFAVFALCLAPNLIWNLVNGLDTVRHTAGNADWNLRDLFHPLDALEFFGSQFGLLGPIPFAALLVAGAGLALTRRRPPEERLALWCLLAPPLVLVMLQALLSRANANWAAAFLPPAAILAASHLAQGGALRTTALALALGSQLVLAAVMSAAAVSPAVADAVGLSNGLKRARGWADTSEAIRAQVAASRPLSAIAVDDRFLFNAVRYYGRQWLNAPGAPPLRAWVREVEAQSEAESAAPLTAADGARVLAVSARPDFRAEFRAAFARAAAGEDLAIPLDRRRTRDLQVFVGEGFSGRPTAP